MVIFCGVISNVRLFLQVVDQGMLCSVKLEDQERRSRPNNFWNSKSNSDKTNTSRDQNGSKSPPI